MSPIIATVEGEGRGACEVKGGGGAFLFSGWRGVLVRGVASLALLRLEGRGFGSVWRGEVGRAVAWLRWLPPAESGFSGALSGGRASSPRRGPGGWIPFPFGRLGGVRVGEVGERGRGRRRRLTGRWSWIVRKERGLQWYVPYNHHG